MIEMESFARITGPTGRVDAAPHPMHSTKADRLFRATSLQLIIRAEN